MINRIVKTLGFSFMLQVPETAVEYNAMAGAKEGEDLCCEEAVDNIIYRSVLTGTRSDFCELLEATFNIPRDTKKVELKSKNEDGTPKYSEVYAETEEVYVNKVLARTGKTRAELQELLDKVVAKNQFDPKVKERKPAGPKKARKDLLHVTEAIVAQGKGDLLAQKLSEKLGKPVAGDANSLALALAEDQRNEEAKRNAELVSSLGITV